MIAYETIHSNAMGKSFPFTNPTISASFDVSKLWIGPADGPVTIELLADNVLTGKTVELSSANNWMATFNNLPRIDPTDGHEIVYGVAERQVAGYESHPIVHGPNDVTFVNYNAQTRNIPVVKTWVGEPLESVLVKLEADHRAIDEVVLSDENGWTHVFENLPVYDSVDGHIIFYWPVEELLPGYRVNMFTDTRSFALTNYNISVVDLFVSKKWEGQQKDEVPVRLLADGIDTGRSLVLDSANDWEGTFEGLLQFDQLDGHKIAYSVEEGAARA